MGVVKKISGCKFIFAVGLISLAELIFIGKTAIAVEVKKVELAVVSSRGDEVCLSRFENKSSNPDSQDHFSESPLNIVSSSAEVFTCVSGIQALGAGWRDPQGIVWYDTVNSEDDSPVKMSLKSAMDFCSEQGARLPTFAEARKLEHWFSIPNSSSNTYSPQILPHADRNFWTLEVKNQWSENDTTLLFVGLKGVPFRVKTSKLFPVRCVKDFS